MSQGTVLFVGDSLVADFNWEDRMPQFDIINYGIPGDTAQGLLDRLPSICAKVVGPKIILVMIGTNNLLIEDYGFIDILRKITVKLAAYYPLADVIINSLIPIQVPWMNDDAVKKINQLTEELTLQTGSCFLDMYGKFSKSAPEFFQADGVHITTKGYDLWSRSILEYIAFLFEQ